MKETWKKPLAEIAQCESEDIITESPFFPGEGDDDTTEDIW
jgi:hypothetical protein